MSAYRKCKIVFNIYGELIKKYIFFPSEIVNKCSSNQHYVLLILMALEFRNIYSQKWHFLMCNV